MLGDLHMTAQKHCNDDYKRCTRARRAGLDSVGIGLDSVGIASQDSVGIGLDSVGIGQDTAGRAGQDSVGIPLDNGLGSPERRFFATCTWTCVQACM